MTRTKKKSVKAREGLDRHQLRSYKQSKLDSPSFAPQNSTVTRRVQDRAVAKARRERLLDSAISSSRRFSALVYTEKNGAHDNDSIRLGDVTNGIEDGRVVVYWVDGSLGGNGRLHGVMGAGLVWHTKGLECTRTYKGGRYTGDSGDAEVFALAAGLAHAKNAIEEGARYEFVRIYSDSLSALSALRVDGRCALGPTIWKTTAVEAIYDLADWFKDRDIRLELRWVKGHHNSAGNKRADRVAHDAAVEQVDENIAIDYSKIGLSRRIKTYADVPAFYKEQGVDWEDEWLSRANVGLAWRPSDRLRPTPQLRPMPIIIHGAKSEDDIQTTTRPATESLDQQIKAIEASITKRTAQIYELQDRQPEDEEWILQVATELQCLEVDQFFAEKELWSKIHRRSAAPLKTRTNYTNNRSTLTRTQLTNHTLTTPHIHLTKNRKLSLNHKYPGTLTTETNRS